MQKVTLGGQRLGSGNKMTVEMHHYERSTHNLSKLWRSTMSAGTLVPFLNEVALPQDTFDIELDARCLTHPTEGPLFGTMKVQLDIFTIPVRLYHAELHNNKLKVGMNMSNVKLPLMELHASLPTGDQDINTFQIEPSCVLHYLGIKGIGIPEDDATDTSRTFCAVPYLGLVDIYKNYYANKQEEIGMVIHTEPEIPPHTIDLIKINGTTIPENPATGTIPAGFANPVVITYTGTKPLLYTIVLNTSLGLRTLEAALDNIDDSIAGTISGTWRLSVMTITNWNYDDTKGAIVPQPVPFDLKDIDTMREKILTEYVNGVPFNINAQNLAPYKYLLDQVDGKNSYTNSQEGLLLKTYQSDLFNNWLSTEWIDGANGINEITAIDTSAGNFKLDALNLAKKVYDMLNRIAISGGSYDDWQSAVYDQRVLGKATTPIYEGGLIKELIFQEVISNSQSQTDAGANQPLGTLAGKGVLSGKHKGGKITIKCTEMSYVMGIVSITPRIDYSQGNKWHVHLETMDDYHKPALDQIGFQELITEQMAWWTTFRPLGGGWIQKSAGKQPAWINYMTDINETHGNFAKVNNEMFMTLNRRYEYEANDIKDLTTYIDPSKFNFIFAQTSLDAQNYWMQIAINMTGRRKLSAKVIPNL